MSLALPRRGRGRQSAEIQARYEAELEGFCDAVLEIQSTLDFQVSARGWSYILEEHGLSKGEFDAAQRYEEALEPLREEVRQAVRTSLESDLV